MSRPCGAALLLSPEAVYPMAGGGALRSASVLHYLARHYAVDLIVFRQPGAEHPGEHLPGGLVRELHVIDLPAHAGHWAARAARNAGRVLRRVPPLMDRFAGFGAQVAAAVSSRRYDLAVIEHFWCAPYWEQVAPASRATLLDLHNIESILHERCARAESGPQALAHRAFAGFCRGLESEWLPRFTWLLATSEADSARLHAIAPGARIEVFPNALPPTPLPTVNQEEVVVFSGNLGYHPNISAVRYFREQIWPGLRERWPGLIWRLVGRNPEAVRRITRGDERIELTGPVQDAISEIARAKVALVPLLAGSGTRFKILEAWAAGVPVVSTPLGAEGLPGRHGEQLLLAADARQFQDAVCALLADPELRSRIGRSGRYLFECEFEWKAAWRGLHFLDPW
jgi:glycosyltransferase involved in cell wall biosynthesis